MLFVSQIIPLGSRNIQVFLKKHAQNLNTPQNNPVSWDLQMGFNSVFKGLSKVGAVLVGTILGF